MMRATLHLVSTRDYLSLRPTLQPMLSAAMQGALGHGRRGSTSTPWARPPAPAWTRGPRTFEEIRGVLREQWPKADERAMGYAVRTHLPLVQVPTDDRWGWPSAACFASAETWIGKPVAAKPDLPGLVLKYLAAFGPASAADAQTWSGLRGLKETFEALRPKLGTFRDEKGRELFDLPKAPRPPEDTTAPGALPPRIRQPPARARRPVARHRRRSPQAGRHRQPPHPGHVPRRRQGGGDVEDRARQASAALVLEPFVTVSKKTRAELAEEGTALLRFVGERSDDLSRSLGLIFERGRSGLDMWTTCDDAIHMSKMIQLRNVPDSLHRRLKARAATEGMSLSEYLITEVRRAAERPSLGELRERLAQRTRGEAKPLSGAGREGGARGTLPLTVVDASAVLELLLRTDKAPRLASRLLAGRESLHAPHLLDLEVAQVLRRYAAAGDLSPERGREALADLADLPLHRYPHDVLLPRIWELRQNVTAYDAAYLALAEVLVAPLVTCDSRLSSAPGSHRRRHRVLTLTTPARARSGLR